MRGNQRIERLKAQDTLYYTCNVTEIKYLLGKKVSRGVVIAGKGEGAFFVDGRYRGGCSDLKSVTVHSDSLEDQKEYITKRAPEKIFFDADSLNLAQYKRLKKIVADIPLEEANPVFEMRMIKDEEELNLIREAAKLNYESYNYLVGQLRVGITEKEAAWIFERYAREHGAEAMGFGPTVAFGAGSSIPHYDTGDTKLKEGMPVLIDVGVKKNSYMSDMTRSFFFQGEYAEYERMHRLVVVAQKEGVEMAKPGVPCCKIDQMIRERFKEAGVEEAFLHATGHGLGLELHEAPRIHHTLDPKIILKEGMVITIEPGLYFDQKWGIRHEDTLIITTQGNENLYESGNRTR